MVPSLIDTFYISSYFPTSKFSLLNILLSNKCIVSYAGCAWLSVSASWSLPVLTSGYANMGIINNCTFIKIQYNGEYG